MSNLFKNNSRFACLAEDDALPEKEKTFNRDRSEKRGKREFKDDVKKDRPEGHNPFKNNRNYRDDHSENTNRFRRYERHSERSKAEELARLEWEEREKNKRIEESLKLENFPSLSSTITPSATSHINHLNFTQTLLTDESQELNNGLDPNLKDGWVLCKKNEKINETFGVADDLPEFEDPIQLLNQLVYLYEKRTEDFIELNGFEFWERMYKFADWQERETEFDDIYESSESSNDEYEIDDGNDYLYENDHI